MTPLTDRDAEILAFGKLWFRHAGIREVEIRERFDMSTTRFAQEQNRIIDLPEALAHDPLEVRRLQRIRDARQLSRSVRRSA